MIPAIIVISVLLCFALWGSYIIFKPPKNCCLLVGVDGGDPETEINLKRVASLAGSQVPIVLVENSYSKETDEICRFFCNAHNSQIILPTELPPSLTECLQTKGR